MTDWYLALAPIAVLSMLLLFRFAGCRFEPRAGGPDPDVYVEAVKADGPVAYWRLREKSGITAKNEIGPPDGGISVLSQPLDAGQPNWRSTAVPAPTIDLGVSDPHLVQTDTTDDNSAIRFNGAFVNAPANAAPLNNLTEFTVEMLLHPEWDISFDLGHYYCALESADFVPIPGQTPPGPKNAGFGIYAGPDNPTDPQSPYLWQFWMGVGNDGFERMFPKPYPQPPNNPVPNPGPTVSPEPTYLAVTFSQSQGKAFLYVYTPNRDIDYTTYELNPLPYVVAAQELTIGITFQGPLTPPFQGPTVLYPFKGLIGDVAIYDQALTEDALRNHVMNAFYNI